MRPKQTKIKGNILYYITFEPSSLVDEKKPLDAGLMARMLPTCRKALDAMGFDVSTCVRPSHVTSLPPSLPPS